MFVTSLTQPLRSEPGILYLFTPTNNALFDMGASFLGYSGSWGQGIIGSGL